MKVNTDSVILGSLTPAPMEGKILDVGTGTGLLALMMAFKTDCRIDALEIDPKACRQAEENVSCNNKSGQVHVISGDFCCFYPNCQYDLIISNPPYFQPGNPSKSAERDLARSTSLLTHRQLIAHSAEILRPEGILSLCIPYSTLHNIFEEVSRQGLKTVKEVFISPREGKDFYLAVLLLKKTPEIIKKDHDELVVRDQNGGFTSKYRQLTASYYLKF